MRTTDENSAIKNEIFSAFVWLKGFEHWRRRTLSSTKKSAKINYLKKDPDALDRSVESTIEIGGEVFVLVAGVESGKI